jgi:Histidine kinase/Histidine kinase-, DNA gyrase B-, and HSP90-like ATPase
MIEQVAISGLLLWVSAIGYGLILRFILREAGGKAPLPLPILLGIMAGWNGFLTVSALRYSDLLPGTTTVSEPWFDPNQLHSAGFARLMVIIIFTLTAHWYYLTAKQQNTAIPGWIQLRYVYGVGIFGVVILASFLFFPQARTEMGVVSLISLFPLLVTIIVCQLRLKKTAGQKSLISYYNLSWIGCLTIILLSLVLACYHNIINDPKPTYYEIYAFVALLPLLFGVIYYHSNYLQLDILIKWVLPAMVWSIGWGGYYGVLAYIGNLWPEKSLVTYIIVAIGVSVPLGLLVGWQVEFTKFIDAQLFKRGDFDEALQTLHQNLGKATTTTGAAALACDTLKKALYATKVYYRPMVNSSGRLDFSLIPETVELRLPLILPVISVDGQNERSWGTLEVGLPPYRQRYLSEDQRFVQFVADNLASALHRLTLQNDKQHKEVQSLKLSNTNKDLQIKLLQSQLNPLFLFNSMNLIANLLPTQPEEAKLVARHLSHIYRYTLESKTKDLVSLREEVKFLQSFLGVEQVRLNDRLSTHFELGLSWESVAIPPMMLYPLVENAIKHGISPQINGGEVIVNIQVKGEEAYFLISDSGIGFDPTRNGNNGMGLNNVRQILATRYQRELQIDSKPNGGTVIRFSFPRGEAKF